MFEWYPYHALKNFAEVEFQRSANASSRSQRPSASSMISMYAKSYRMVVHPILTADYLANLTRKDSNSTTIVKAFGASLAKPKSLMAYVQRHPVFAKRISDWLDQTATNKSSRAATGILQATHPAKLISTMHDWLCNNSERRVQFSLKVIPGDRARRLSKKVSTRNRNNYRVTRCK